MNARKSQLETANEQYEKEADKYSFEAEIKENLELLKLSNNLKRACKGKQKEHDDCPKKKEKLMSKNGI